MKIECPNCWQHFDVDEADLDAEFTCPNCNFQFIGRQAPRLPKEPRIWPLAAVIAVLCTLLAVSAAANVWLWRQSLVPLRRPPVNSNAGLGAMTALMESHRELVKRDMEALRLELAARTEQLRTLEMRERANAAAVADAQEKILRAAGIDARVRQLEELHEKYSLEVMSGLIDSLRKRVIPKSPASK